MNSRDFFQSLGAAIRDEWAGHQHDPLALPPIAERHFHRSRPAENVTWEAIAEEALTNRQRRVTEADVDFGQPNINVFVDRRFYIEALFWVDGTTDIHQHGFSGAFYVLNGGSVHSTYDFDQTKRVNEQFRLGQVSQRNIELLKTGDCRQILGGSSLIHSLFHLDQPSVTLVARTHGDLEGRPQFSFAYPGIATYPAGRDQYLTLAIRTLKMLHKIQSPRFEAMLVDCIRTSDARDAFELMKTFDAGLTVEQRALRFDNLAGVFDEDVLAAMKVALRSAARADLIASLRTKVTDPALRQTLGILLNARSKEALFAVLQTTFPGDAPRGRFLESLRALAAMDIGFTADVSIDIAGHLLDGCSDDEVITRLASEFGQDEIIAMRADLVEACTLLRNHYLIAPTLDAR